MALFGPSNQLLQIDSGDPLKYIYNPSQGLAPYAGIGENQVLGQRYVNVNFSYFKPNPNGVPQIFVLAQYLSTSATSLANWQTANGPAPVYWTDQTYTTVSGIKSEGFAGAGNFNDIAGYWMPSYPSLPNLTLPQLLGGWGLVMVAGVLQAAYGPTATANLNSFITGANGAFQSAGIVAGTAPGYRTFGIQTSAVAAGLCNVLVNCDVF